MFLQALAIALLAYATLGHKPSTEWLKACVEHAMSILSDFDAQAVANTLWGLGFMDYLPPALWTSLMKPFDASICGLIGRQQAACSALSFRQTATISASTVALIVEGLERLARALVTCLPEMWLPAPEDVYLGLF